MTRGSKILAKVLGVVAASCVALALAFELYLRAAGFLSAQPANYPCVTGDPVLNHVFQKNCEGTAYAAALKTSHDATYRTNGLGYRGHAPEAGRHTLVVLGDSYTEGFGLEESQAFPAALETSLREKGAANWQVLNGGTLGFSPALYPAYFDRYFRATRPERVLLNLDLSDFNDDPYFLQIADYDNAGTPVAFPGREIFPTWALPYVYGNKIALLRFAHQEANQWNQIRRREAVRARMDAWIRSERPRVPEPELRAAGLAGCAKPIEAVAKHIQLLRERVETAGGRLAIHMYPPGSEVKSYASLPQGISFVRAWDQRNRTDFSWWCGVNAKVVDIFRNFAAREGIAFFDSYPTVLARADRAELYYDRDAHWNEKGVRVVVDGLAGRLLPWLRGGSK